MRRSIETAFKPAAIAVEQTPPAPAGRALLWIILMFFTCTLAWAWFGHVDIVTVAPGRLIPNGQTKTVQSLAIGTVEVIHVKEGQRVQTGDPLVSLDAGEAEAELRRLTVALDASMDETQRVNRLLSWLEGAKATVADTDPLAFAQWQAYQSQLAVLERERARRDAETTRARQQVHKLTELLPIVTRRADDQRRLAAKKVIPEQQYLETEQQRLVNFHDLNAQRVQVNELQAASEELTARISLVRDEYARDLNTRRRDSRLQIDSLRQEINKARTRLDAHRLTAPVTGIVQQLTVHNPGAVVTPAQQLMVIVPEEYTLEVEALVENRDIGFIGVGQPAEVKVEAFPFTKYGTLAGRVVDLSSDAIADEQRGWVYKMRVAVDDPILDAGGRQITLTPGMTTTTEIKTGSRRVIEFFLSPLLRYRDESIRER